MARAVKAVTTYRGRSPSAFSLLAFGGNGPLFAAGLARELDIPRVIVPAAAGLFSSVGLLDADEKQYLVRACPGPVDRIDPVLVAAALRDLELEARAVLGGHGSLRLERAADLRYRGQSSVLTVPVPDGPIDRAALRGLGRAFGREHERTYGYAPPREPVELASVRLVASPASQSADRPSVALLAGRGAMRQAATMTGGSRRAWFGPETGWLETLLLERHDLTGGRAGPFIVEEYDATILVPPGCSATADTNGLVTIEVGA